MVSDPIDQDGDCDEVGTAEFDFSTVSVCAVLQGCEVHTLCHIIPKHKSHGQIQGSFYSCA